LQEKTALEKTKVTRTYLIKSFCNRARLELAAEKIGNIKIYRRRLRRPELKLWPAEPAQDDKNEPLIGTTEVCA